MIDKDINLDDKLISSEGEDIAFRQNSKEYGSFVDIKVGTPDQENEAANRAYVDAAVSGFDIKATVKAATTTNIDISKDLENGDGLDGTILFTGEKVLVMHQTDVTQNGVYIVSEFHAARRFISNDFIQGAVVYVEQGTQNSEKFFSFEGSFTGAGGTPNYGTDAITFNQRVITKPPTNTTTPSGQDNDETFRLVISFNAPAQNFIGSVDANQAVTIVSVRVLQSFNDPAATLTIGDSINGVDFLMPNANVDLTISDKYIIEDPKYFTAAANIYAYLNSGTSTTGAVEILVTKV